MNAITIPLSPDTAEKVARIACERGVSVETLMSDVAMHLVQQFDTYTLYLQEAERGQHEVDQALEMLKRP
jgi:predicted transcriptional regulator